MNRFIYFAAIVILCISFSACEKDDSVESSIISEVDSEFFRHSKAGGDEYKSFVLNVLSQVDDSIAFTGDFVATYGLPKWNVNIEIKRNDMFAMAVPVTDKEMTRINAIYYFALGEEEFEYYLFLNDRDDVAYESMKHSIQVLETQLGLELSNTDFRVKLTENSVDKNSSTKARRNEYVSCRDVYVGTIENPYEHYVETNCTLGTPVMEWYSNRVNRISTGKINVPNPLRGGGGIGNTEPEPDPYKYPDGTNYEIKYPKLTDYLKNQISKITLNERIMLALQGYGQFTDKQIQDLLNWGDGPIIEILDISSVFNKDAYGLFSPQTSNKLYLDKSLAEEMESSSGIKSEALLFLVAVTILHETVHLGDLNFDNKKWEFEAGNTFERYVYGEMINEGNAQKHLELWIGK